MNKIICDVCGTSFMDTADHCPICGYAHNRGISSAGEMPEDLLNKGGKFSSVPVKKHKAIFDFDEENPDTEEEVEAYAYEQRQEYTQQKPANTVTPASMAVVIILVVIITLLLVGIGFLLFRYYIPNSVRSEATTATMPAASEPVETTPVEETTVPSIPCTSLVLTSGVSKLTRQGQYWLLHVMVSPEDTTDPLVYYSEDESIVTVNEHGRITAVGEGETTVFIQCGEKEIKCRVVVSFEEEATQPTEAEETVPNVVEHEALPEEAAAPAQTQPETTEATQAPEKVEPTEATQASKDSSNVVLKLKKSDLSSGVRGVKFQLELDCDLDPKDVTWLTLDSNVAVVHDGVVTTIGPGKTKIVAQYQGQQAECIVRCTFS